jgi:UDP-sugar pyrophosphorylase
VDIIKQENVPALYDNSRIAIDKDSKKILTKPHGHGDVHSLLYSSGLVKKWKDIDKEWIVFV